MIVILCKHAAFHFDLWREGDKQSLSSFVLQFLTNRSGLFLLSSIKKHDYIRCTNLLEQ